MEEATSVTPDLVEALAKLVPQLSSSAPPLTADQVRELVSSPATVLFVARRDEDREVVGTLTLALFRIPTGLRAWIEDVIVDEPARGGDHPRVGEQLTTAAINRARQAGARTVDLTSAPRRIAANKVYERMGFQRRETNVWRFELEA